MNYFIASGSGVNVNVEFLFIVNSFNFIEL